MPIETPSNQPAEWLKQQARHVLWECDEYGIELGSSSMTTTGVIQKVLTSC